MATNIRRARQLSGLSLTALKEKHNFDRSVVHNWEMGRRTPTTTSLERLAAALGCRIEFFFTGDDKYLPKPKIDLKPIPEFPGYFAGSDGLIYSTLKGPLRACKSKSNLRDKYYRVELHRGGRRYPRTVHGLIALAFLGPRPEGLTVSHKNGNSRDNRASNLTYETLAKNISRKSDHGTEIKGSDSPQSKLDRAQVAEIRVRLAEGVSAIALGRAFGVSDTVIRNIKHGRSYKDQ